MQISKDTIRFTTEQEKIEYADCLLAKTYEKVLGKETKLQSIVSNRINYTSQLIQDTAEKELKDFTGNDLNEILNKYYSLKNQKSLRENSCFHNKSIKELIIKLLNIKDNEEVIDLGSGEGLFFQTIKNNDINVKAKGVEINLRSYENSLLLTSLLGFNPEFINDDIKNINNIKYDKGFIYPSLGMSILDNDKDFIDNENFKKLSSFAWLFVDKLIDGLTVNNKFIAVLPDSCLFRNHDDNYRTYLLENNYIESIIKLPSNVLYETTSPLNIIVFSKNNKEIKIFDTNKYKSMSDTYPRINNIDVENTLIDFNSNETFTIKYNDLDSNELLVSKFLQEKIVLKHSVKLSDVIEVNQGTQHTMSNFKDKISNEDTKYKILTSNDIVNNNVNFNELINIEEDIKLLKRTVKQNDIVMTAKSTIVKSVLVNNIQNNNIVVTGGMFILTTNPERMNPMFFKIFLESDKGQAVIKSIQKGSTIPIITKTDLMNLDISCPPLKIQDDIVEEYIAKKAIYNECKSTLDKLESELKMHFELTEEKY